MSRHRDGMSRRKSLAWRFLLAALGLGMLAAQAGETAAQSIPDGSESLTPDQMQQLLNGQGRPAAQPTPIQPSVSPNTMILEPTAAAPAPLPRSKLEEIMSARAGTNLSQFGYDVLGAGRSVSLPQMGAIEDDYVLGPSDEIIVTLRGQENASYRTEVDRDGQVVLPRLAPVLAAGRTLGAFKKDLLSAIHRAYVSTEGFVTVGRLRQISVLVAGDVGSPGVRTLTGLSTPLDAILVSGGVTKAGSLRNIRLIRGKHVYNIDLYAVLVGQGTAKQMTLSDGDKLVVPPIGHTVAIAGFVRRPGIYELPAGQSAIGEDQLLSLAAGTAIRGVSTISVLRIMPNGTSEFVDISGQPYALISDGEIVVVKSAVNIALGRVELTGAVRTPGAFSLTSYPSLHSILPSSEALLPNAYMLLGFIERTDPRTLERGALPFSPLHVVEGREDVKLLSDDVIHVLTRDEASFFVTIALGHVGSATGLADSQESPEAAKPSPMPASQGQALSEWSAKGLPPGLTGTTAVPATPVAGAVNETATGAEAASTGAPAQNSISSPAIASSEAGSISDSDSEFFGKRLSDYRAEFDGAVHDPGAYLIAPNTTLAEAISGIGGLDYDVDRSRFELTSTTIDNDQGTSRTIRSYHSATNAELANIILQPYDKLTFHHVFSDKENGVVSIDGQVRYPGQYSYVRGERLSSLLARAGGLTDQAYPDGTVYLRASVAKLEQESFAKTADQIENQLLAAISRGNPNEKADPAAFTVAQTYVASLRTQKGLGRIDAVADPAILKSNPDKDPLLESGDSIFIPKLPTTVSVLGEVMEPGGILYQRGLSAMDYIHKAGGFSQFADDSLTYIVLPNGSAEKLDRPWLPFDSESIPPGSMIIVPRDIAPLRWSDILSNATQIFSQLAIAGASLAVIAKQ